MRCTLGLGVEREKGQRGKEIEGEPIWGKDQGIRVLWWYKEVVWLNIQIMGSTPLKAREQNISNQSKESS